MDNFYKFGFPNKKREEIIFKALKNPITISQPIEYRGQYRNLEVIEVEIRLPVYRIENIRETLINSKIYQSISFTR